LFRAQSVGVGFCLVFYAVVRSGQKAGIFAIFAVYSVIFCNTSGYITAWVWSLSVICTKHSLNDDDDDDDDVVVVEMSLGLWAAWCCRRRPQQQNVSGNCQSTPGQLTFTFLSLFPILFWFSTNILYIRLRGVTSPYSFSPVWEQLPTSHPFTPSFSPYFLSINLFFKTLPFFVLLTLRLSQLDSLGERWYKLPHWGLRVSPPP